MAIKAPNFYLFIQLKHFSHFSDECTVGSFIPQLNKGDCALRGNSGAVFEEHNLYVQKALHRIFVKIWETGDIPNSWATAFIVLLSKSEQTSDPSEFRPIALTNTSGKIFFSVVAKRLEKFMVCNNYIERHTQKGFLSEVAGCTEHAFAL